MSEQDQILRFEDLPFPDSDDEEAFDKFMPIYREYHRQLMSRQLDKVWELVYGRTDFQYPNDLLEYKVGDCLEKLDQVILAAFMYGAEWAFFLDEEIEQRIKAEKIEEAEGTENV